MTDPPSWRRPGAASPPTLVVGLGNPILGDDGIGLAVARRTRELLDEAEAAITEASLGGLELLDVLAGFERAFLVDAITTEDGTPGDVYRLLPEALPMTDRLTAVHEVDLATALAMGRRLGVDLPREVVIFAVEAADVSTFGDSLSPALATVVDRVAEDVVREVRAVPPGRPS
jgi:hydrogenase maturation protease